MGKGWFEVDKNGLAQLLHRRGKAFVLYEMIQNAWDQKCREVEVELIPLPRSPYARLTIRDDDPLGFVDLGHAFTVFADSAKKHNPEQRGRFNLGEKLVLALCKEAEISTTTGTVSFTAFGRIHRRRRTERGSVFSGILPMTRTEYEACCAAVKLLIPPENIATFFNGTPLEPRVAIHGFTATLPTELADADGYLRPTRRNTTVRIYEPRPGEAPQLYEMGIPVVEAERWHIDVRQKVPLTLDRENVPPAYWRTLHAAVLNEMHAHLNIEDANAPWVRLALADPACSPVAVGSVLTQRFGEKRVAYDPSDPEANKIAVARGYVVVHGSQLSAAEWENARRCQALPPAGQVTPSPKAFSDHPDAKPLKVLPAERWSPELQASVSYIQRLAERLLGSAITVRIADDPDWAFAAAYGPGRLTLNSHRLGPGWFERPWTPAMHELLIHEFGHHYSCDHLDAGYHEALCRLGARLAHLAIEEPDFFREGRPR